MKKKKISEFDLIKQILSAFKQNSDKILVSAGDDCAIIRGSSDTMTLITTDMLVEDVHFRIATSPGHLLGRKSMAVNLSDIAAMGGTPESCFLSIGKPSNLDNSYFNAVISGMAEICDEYSVVLAGGDTTSSPGPLIINLSVTGSAADGNYKLRTGAEAGDIVQISGKLGGSAAGLKILEQFPNKKDEYPSLVAAHLDPSPRIHLGQFLANQPCVHAMIDLSDGLLQDLGHIVKQSQCGASLDGGSIPLFSEALKFYNGDTSAALKDAVTGGEDYELCWTVSRKDAEDLLDSIRMKGFSDATSIGVITDTDCIDLFYQDKPLVFNKSGWDHFTQEDLD